MPHLSIIIPVYNKAEYLDLCVDSILKQTFTDFELIVVNDGSTDGSAERCDYFAQVDPRVVVIHQLNQGVSAARNAGLKMARGLYVGFADGDDHLEADMYEFLLAAAKEHEADVSICGVKKVFPDKVDLFYGSGRTSIYDTEGAVSALLKKEFLRSVYDKVYRAEIAKSVAFEGRINEDIFYNFMVLQKCSKTVFHDVIKYNYIIRDNSVSMTGFSLKWMDTIDFSRRIVKICRDSMPRMLDRAREFDLVTHISLLNQLLLSGKERHEQEYQQVVRGLSDFSDFINRDIVRKKHRAAFRLFRTSPLLYRALMSIYCRITNADVSKKSM